jgi:hypothetical protein
VYVSMFFLFISFALLFLVLSRLFLFVPSFFSHSLPVPAVFVFFLSLQSPVISLPFLLLFLLLLLIQPSNPSLP